MGIQVVYTNSSSNTESQLRTQTSQRSGAYDPVDKLRVSTPQALIDTDFEYGTQPTKWESIGLQQNRQSVYYIPQSPLVIDNSASSKGIQGAGTTSLVIFMTSTAGISVGTPIYVQNATDANANGWWYATAVSANVSVTVTTANVVASGNQFNPGYTYVYLGYFYSNCGINLGSNAFTVTSATTITVTTATPHGLSAGSYIYVVGLGGSPVNVMGAFTVTTVPTSNTFTYTTSGASGSPTNSAGNVNLYARPSGYVESRPFDGGVAFTAGSVVPNQQLIRQTRRYFRYQSGKGIQFSTGTCLKPAIFTTSLTASSTSVGATITVTTRYSHNLAVGTVVQVAGVNETGYNGNYTIATVPTPNTLTYTATTAPSSATATGTQIKVSPFSWYGSSNRIGFFDQQNGMFFEFDGQTLYAVWRSSTTQLNGTVAVTNGSGLVTGTGTQFATQLTPGDYIVIRGQSYKVVNIAGNTAMYISPEYRGATLNTTNTPNAGYIVSKTIDVRVPQSSWFDPCNGTGPSGYNLDLTKMQMFYIDYSWYGAGVIRWGFRTTGGAIIYVYAQQNNNIQTEAYMRSGNMAAHYESNQQNPVTYLTADLASGTTTSMSVGDASLFAPSGTAKVTAASATGAIEYITYTGKTSTTLTGLTRGATGGSAATTFTYSATAPIAVEYSAPDSAPSLSHWGSSAIMDGRFDDDKSLIFNYGSPAKLTTTTSITQLTPVLAIRISPSVDNGTTGLMGIKETINRMQLQFVELGIYATGPLLVNLVLNGYSSGAFSSSFQSPVTSGAGAVTSSLAQVATNITNSISITGGESVAAAFTNTNGQTTLDLSQVRDLGNSILGGGTSTSIPTSQANFYPDGPDILYVCVTPLTATAIDVFARLSWKEAQA